MPHALSCWEHQHSVFINVIIMFYCFAANLKHVFGRELTHPMNFVSLVLAGRHACEGQGACFAGFVATCFRGFKGAISTVLYGVSWIAGIHPQYLVLLLFAVHKVVWYIGSHFGSLFSIIYPVNWTFHCNELACQSSAILLLFSFLVFHFLTFVCQATVCWCSQWLRHYVAHVTEIGCGVPSAWWRACCAHLHSTSTTAHTQFLSIRCIP